MICDEDVHPKRRTGGQKTDRKKGDMKHWQYSLKEIKQKYRGLGQQRYSEDRICWRKEQSVRNYVISGEGGSYILGIGHAETLYTKTTKQRSKPNSLRKRRRALAAFDGGEEKRGR